MSILREAGRPDRLVTYTEVGDEIEISASTGTRIDLNALAAWVEEARTLVPPDQDASTLHLLIDGCGDDRYLYELTFQLCTSRVETDAEYEARQKFEREREEWARGDAEKKERMLYTRLKKKFEGKKP